jgi:hypothetical protein
MRKLVLLLSLLFFCNPTMHAADQAPTIEFKLQSVKEMLQLLPYLGDVVDQAEPAEQGAKFIEAMAGKKGIIEGLDITKPIGAYATMTPAVVDSPIVLLLPVGDEKAFLNLLSGKLGLNPEKGEDEIYSLVVPNVPPKFYFKFQNGYANVTIHNKGSLEARNLITPATFFAKPERSLMTMTIHLDRVPNDVRKTVLGQAELKFNDEKAKPEKSAFEGKLRALILDAILSSGSTLMTDGKTARLAFDIEPKTDDLSLSLSVMAKDGTELKNLFVESATRKSPVLIASGKNPVMAGVTNLKVPDSFKQRFSDVVDLAMGEFLEKAKGNDRDGAKLLLEAIEPTLKAGLLQFGIGVNAIADGKHELQAAVRVTSGLGIEKLAKTFAPFLPEDQGKVKFDVEKLNRASLHEILPTTDHRFESFFGKSSFWLTTAEDLLVMGVANTSDQTKSIANATPNVTPVLGAEMSYTQVFQLTPNPLKPEIIQALTKELFPDGVVKGNDTIKLAVTTGEKLDASLKIKGKALHFTVKVQNKQRNP